MPRGFRAAAPVLSQDTCQAQRGSKRQELPPEGQACPRDDEDCRVSAGRGWPDSCQTDARQTDLARPTLAKPICTEVAGLALDSRFTRLGRRKPWRWMVDL